MALTLADINGQTTFAVPDLRGWLDEHSNTLGNGTLRGSPTLQLSVAQLAGHLHLADLRITKIEHLSNGNAQLTVTGGSLGTSVEIQGSPDFTTWSRVGILATDGPPATFTDTGAPGKTRLFYRARP